MGKQLNLLRKLIKEELEIALSEELNEEAMDDIVDYLLSEEYLHEEEIDEVQGRTKGTGKMYKLKGGKDIDEVKKFLTKIQTLISNKEGRGRKGMNFTDTDIDAFSELLTREDGFNRDDILDTISFYKGKPKQAAQKIMDVLGDPKVVGKGGKVDLEMLEKDLKKAEENKDTSEIQALKKEIKSIKVGKGYIELVGTTKIEKPNEAKPKAKKEKEVVNTDTEEVDVDEFEDAEDGKIDDEFDGFDDSEAGLEIDTDIEGGYELAQLKKKKNDILAQLNSGEISMDEYKEKIGDIPSKIKALKKKMAADLDVEDDEDEMINESLVYMFQKRAGLLNG